MTGSIGIIRDLGIRFRTATKAVGTRVGVKIDASAFGKPARVSALKKFRRENWR